jgi:hypothetical protein
MTSWETETKAFKSTVSTVTTAPAYHFMPRLFSVSRSTFYFLYEQDDRPYNMYIAYDKIAHFPSYYYAIPV